MAIHRRRTRKKQMAEINVVPYIDVMLVLLIIFMVTAPMLNQGVEVDLPQASTKPLGNQQAEPLVLTVTRKGEYYLNIGDNSDKPLAAKQVLIRAAAVLRNRKDTPVLVKGDKDVPYGEVVQAMALLQGAGAPKVGLMTDAPGYEAPGIRSANDSRADGADGAGS